MSSGLNIVVEPMIVEQGPAVLAAGTGWKLFDFRVFFLTYGFKVLSRNGTVIVEPMIVGQGPAVLAAGTGWKLFDFRVFF